MNKKIIILGVSLLCILPTVLLTKAMVFDSSTWIYRFHLYYDQGKVVVNRDAPESYDMDTGPYQPKEPTATETYRLEIVSPSGQTLFLRKFDPQNGNPSFIRGAFDLEAQSFSNAKTANFYNSAGTLLLTIDLSGTLYCNENKICEEELGEDSNTCPVDCGSPTPIVSVVPSVSTIPSGGDSSNWLIIVLVVLLVLAVAGAAVWFILKKRQNKASDISVTLP